jgi:hypothetical protein
LGYILLDFFPKNYLVTLFGLHLRNFVSKSSGHPVWATFARFFPKKSSGHPVCAILFLKIIWSPCSGASKALRATQCVNYIVQPSIGEGDLEKPSFPETVDD